MSPKYIPTDNAMLCYDLGSFHPGCPDCSLSYPWLYCPTCRVVAHIDLVGVHCTPGSITQERGM